MSHTCNGDIIALAVRCNVSRLLDVWACVALSTLTFSFRWSH